IDFAAAAKTGEPQLLIRANTTHTARLAPTPHPTLQPPDGEPGTAADAADVVPGLFGLGTVLITGGTGMAGAVLAGHVVGRYGVRRVVLASRGGDRAEGVGE